MGHSRGANNDKAVWVRSLGADNDKVRRLKAPGGAVPERKRKVPPGAGAGAPPEKPQARKRADALPNGTKLCRGFNQGKCNQTGGKCNFAHRCSIIKPNGGVCGGQHAAVNHR